MRRACAHARTHTPPRRHKARGQLGPTRTRILSPQTPPHPPTQAQHPRPAQTVSHDRNPVTARVTARVTAPGLHRPSMPAATRAHTAQTAQAQRRAGPVDQPAHQVVEGGGPHYLGTLPPGQQSTTWDGHDAWRHAEMGGRCRLAVCRFRTRSVFGQDSPRCSDREHAATQSVWLHVFSDNPNGSGSGKAAR